MSASFRQSFALFLGLVAPIALHAQQNPAPSFLAHKIPLVADKTGGFLLCPAKIDGENAYMLVDSGAHMEIATTKAWANAHNKELTKAGKGTGIVGTTDLFTTKLDTFRIQSAIAFSPFKANVIDLPLPLQFDPSPDGNKVELQGLLGCTFLMKSQAVINYADNHLYIPAQGNGENAYLKQSIAAGDRVMPLFKAASGAPYVSIKFGEKEYWFLVDNAAGGNALLPEVAKQVGWKRQRTKVEVGGAGGTQKGIENGIVNDVIIGGLVRLPAFDFDVIPIPGGSELPEGKTYGGIVGNGFLKQLRTRIDFASYHIILPALAQGDKNRPDSSNNPLPDESNKKMVKIKPGSSPEEVFEQIVEQTCQTIPLTRSTTGSYYVESMINGKARWLCLDSGANATILDLTVAREDQIALQDASAASGAEGESVATQRGVVKTFAVGPTAFQSPTMVFADLSNFSPLKLPDGSTQPLSGLLGTPYFKAVPVTVDFPHSRIILNKANIAGGITGLRKSLQELSAPLIEAPNGLRYLQVEANGTKALLLVDIGAQSLQLFEESAVNMNLTLEPMAGTTNTLGKKGASRKKTTIKSLKLGDHKIASALEVMVLTGAKQETLNQLPVIGIAGCNVFETFKATIDFPSNIVLFHPGQFVK